MTTIDVITINDTFRITAYDHATGSEKVCAAISTLMYTLEGWLINNPSSSKNHISELKSGYAFIEFEMLDDKAKAVTSAIVFGLMQLENAYGDYLKVRIDKESIKTFLSA